MCIWLGMVECVCLVRHGGVCVRLLGNGRVCVSG